MDFARYMRRGAADKPFGGVSQALKTVAMRKLPRYRCHLGCILLKMAAMSLLTGLGFVVVWNILSTKSLWASRAALEARTLELLREDEPGTTSTVRFP